MIKLFPSLMFLLLIGCSNEKKQDEPIQPKLATSLKQAAMNFTLVDKITDRPYLSGRTYYEYLNYQSMKESFTVTDSIKVENFWILFYKYSINGHNYNSTNWFINIKGYYFISGEYFSSYNADEYFDKENIDLVNALFNKAKSWEDKSEKHWWKYIE